MWSNLGQLRSKLPLIGSAGPILVRMGPTVIKVPPKAVALGVVRRVRAEVARIRPSLRRPRLRSGKAWSGFNQVGLISTAVGPLVKEFDLHPKNLRGLSFGTMIGIETSMNFP